MSVFLTKDTQHYTETLNRSPSSFTWNIQTFSQEAMYNPLLQKTMKYRETKTYNCNTCLTTCWQTSLFSATELPGQTTASQIDVSWNLLSSDLSPQNSLKAVASGVLAAGPLSKMLVENSVSRRRPKVSLLSLFNEPEGGVDATGHCNQRIKNGI